MGRKLWEIREIIILKAKIKEIFGFSFSGLGQRVHVKIKNKILEFRNLISGFGNYVRSPNSGRRPVESLFFIPSSALFLYLG